MVRFFSRKTPAYAPFKGSKVTIDSNKKGFTIKGPVPSEYFVAAEGNTDPTYWNKVISKWEAKPLYIRKNDANLYKLIEKENEAFRQRHSTGRFSQQRPKIKTVIKEVKTPTSKSGNMAAEAPSRIEEPVKPLVSIKPFQTPVAAKFNQMQGSEIKDIYVPFSKKTAEKLKTKDIAGKKYARSPAQVAKEMNLSKETKERFMEVLTGRRRFQDLPVRETADYDTFRNKVRSGGARLGTGEGSFG